jgi:hypothetical protein
MMRRTYIIGTITLGLTLTAARTSAYCRVLMSAHSFQHYFHDLKQADDSLNPLQRIVFSLVLANGHPSEEIQHHS